MLSRTETLTVGSRAPEFLLPAATLVVDRERKVVYIYRGDSHTDRSPLDQVLEAVRKVSVSG